MSKKRPLEDQSTEGKNKKHHTMYTSQGRLTPDINLYFPNVEFNCPESDDRGEPLTGDTSISVLQDLLDDLQMKGADLSVCSAERVLLTGPQAELQTQLNILDNSFGKILEKVDFQQDNHDVLKKSYERLLERLRRYSSYHLSKDLQWAFDALSEFVVEALKESYEVSSLMHGRLVHFLTLIINEICLPEGGTKRWLCEVRSGEAAESLSFTLDSVVHRSMSRCVSTDSEENQPQDPKVLFRSRPDLVCSMKSRPSDDTPDTSSSESDFVFPLIVKVKTTFSEICYGMTKLNPLISEISSYGDASVPMMGNTSEQQDDLGDEFIDAEVHTRGTQQTQGHRCSYSRLNQLRTQHLIELMSALKNDRVKSGNSSPVKAFGLYVVMNRVYITCLTVASEKRKRVPNILKYKFINGITKGNGLKYRLVCSKWLNLFRRSHLIVLLQWINFLFYHEYKFINTSAFGED